MLSVPYQLADETRDEVFDAAAACFLLLSEPTRLKIMRSICNGEKSVTAIAEQTGTTQPNISRHLGLMHRAGMVKRRRDGNQIFYCTADAEMPEVCQIVCERVIATMARHPPLRLELSHFFDPEKMADFPGKK